MKNIQKMTGKLLVNAFAHEPLTNYIEKIYAARGMA
jgi:hypothetical protein